MSQPPALPQLTDEVSSQVYNCETLRLVLVGPQVCCSALRLLCARSRIKRLSAVLTDAILIHLLAPVQLPHNIRALAAKGDLTFAATRSLIVECCRIAR